MTNTMTNTAFLHYCCMQEINNNKLVAVTAAAALSDTSMRSLVLSYTQYHCLSKHDVDSNVYWSIIAIYMIKASKNNRLLSFFCYYWYPIPIMINYYTDVVQYDLQFMYSLCVVHHKTSLLPLLPFAPQIKSTHTSENIYQAMTSNVADHHSGMMPVVSKWPISHFLVYFTLFCGKTVFCSNCICAISNIT